MTVKAIQSDVITDIQKGEIPVHVAVIMDGNGRWAQERGMPRVFGHQQGAESVREIVETAAKLGVKILTLFAFSDENWGRPKMEVKALMKLLDTYVLQERAKLKKENVRFQAIGALDQLPEKTLAAVLRTQQELSHCTGLTLNIALSYGGRNEILTACKKLAKKAQAGIISPQDITPQIFEEHLWTSGLPDPDLLIRTSGEQRISNFLLWQIAYTELWFTPVYWPEFRKEHFYEGIKAFQSRKRRYGLLAET
ncbi:MAG: isoprenyl transferase [Deltaproteobacteria bacterium]|nr:isoprenyl transferase [Deltaproteobacteria bacterium]